MQTKQIIRNNTSFPIQITAKLKDLYDKYKKELENNGDELMWAKNLKYYQYLIKELILNDVFSENDYARGLLIYHTMGMGKTRLAVAVAMSCWNTYQPVILLPQGLKKNFKKTIEELTKLLNGTGNAAQSLINEAINKFQFVSMDAYNSSTQMENIGNSKKLKSLKKGGADLFQNGLDNKLLIVDEAHNFFRSIINSGSENSNARKIYEIIMSAKNLKILFLTGTPCAKDPFELVPCFNMLAGKNLLPTSYEIFYNLYIDKKTNSILNKNKLSNRLLGLVSHVTHNKNSQPISASSELAAAPLASSDSERHSKKNRDSGWFPECKPIIISYVQMSPQQYKQYLLAREKEETEKGRGSGKSIERVNSTPLALPNSEKKSMGSYYVKSRIISNFSPPRDYIDKPIDDIPNKLFTEQTSPKLNLISDRINKAKGSVLVYSQFIDKGGLRPLSKYLENKGFTEFNIHDIQKHSHILLASKKDSKQKTSIPHEDFIFEEKSSKKKSHTLKSEFYDESLQLPKNDDLQEINDEKSALTFGGSGNACPTILLNSLHH